MTLYMVHLGSFGIEYVMAFVDIWGGEKLELLI